MSQPSILIVEDENISAMSLKRRLIRLGYSVAGVASTAKAAVRLTYEKRPQLVLMDIALKGKGDGVQAARRINALNIPVVYLSALSDEATLNRAKRTDPSGFLVKPLEERSLHAAIQMALHKHDEDSKLKTELMEIKKTEEELETFAATASHDLREPLRTMACYVRLIELESENQLSPKLKEYLRFVVDAAPRLQTLVRDLQSYSKIGKEAAGPEMVDCNNAYDDAVSNLEALISDTGAELTCDPLPKVLSREGEMTQVFQNILGNALKYRTTKKPLIHTTAVRVEGAWQFSVSDNGIGIPPEATEKIFRPFLRLHSKNEYEGTGIGLSICKKIVAKQGGRIWAKSSGKDGSEFLFTVPLANRSNERLSE